ncbi:MAG: cupin domain-containing protein [Alphaproteobacteria bacterium]|nr:MAG: cupin domain-containing protein [Alphaproteobacteria bacterium]
MTSRTEPLSTATTEAEPWGTGCYAWRLIQSPDLAVAEEEMPPGSSEVAHHHRHARQVFYVLSGKLTMEVADATHDLAPGQAIDVAPGVVHRACNPWAEAVRFLVISTPTTLGDRVATAEPA